MMMLIYNKYIDEYFALIDGDDFPVSNDILKAKRLIENKLSQEDVYIDHEQVELAITKIEEYFPYKLFIWEKFILALIHTYYDDGTLVWSEFLLLMGRGAGKNGFISPVTWYLTTFYGIQKYNVDIVANSEEQAKTSFMDIHDLLESNTKLQKAFRYNLKEIVNKKSKSEIKYRTSNAKTKDGLRPGCVIFDEIHAYENYDNINVFQSALGKTSDPRIFYITTNGHVRGSVLDDMLESAESILNGEEPESRVLPLIYRLDDESEVHDFNMWHKANPSLRYKKDLQIQMASEYRKMVKQPSLAVEFMTKRMNLPAQNSTCAVAEWEKIKATNRVIPDLSGHKCIGAIDFASVRDFCSCGLLFKKDNDYIFFQHTFICHLALKLENRNFKFDVAAAERQGLCTIINEDCINERYITDWFIEQAKKYDIIDIVCDTYRSSILKSAFNQVGMPLNTVRSGYITHNLVHPLIEKLFAEERIVFGDDMMMRWYTNNVYVETDGKGNKSYQKIEPLYRKTDGFFAFLHAMSVESKLNTNDNIEFFDIFTF